MIGTRPLFNYFFFRLPLSLVASFKRKTFENDFMFTKYTSCTALHITWKIIILSMRHKNNPSPTNKSLTDYSIAAIQQKSSRKEKKKMYMHTNTKWLISVELQTHICLVQDEEANVYSDFFLSLLFFFNVMLHIHNNFFQVNLKSQRQFLWLISI